MKKKNTVLGAALAAVLCVAGAAGFSSIGGSAGGEILPDEIPEYSGVPYVEVAGGVPFFDVAVESGDSLETGEAWESYSPLDELGRPGVACANIGPELMPDSERESIGMVRPVGFVTVRYDDLIADKYLYNRCHLIGFQLTGENANPQNLITGTRYLNVEGMLPFENQVADYIRATGGHVLYRVTPIYSSQNLLCRGLQMEAWSVEDSGAGVCFNVFVYNVQPGITIDYATGESWRTADSETGASDAAPASNSSDASGGSGASGGSNSGGGDSGAPDAAPGSTSSGSGSAPHSAGPDAADARYVLNTNTHKFHDPSCGSVADMKEKNRRYTSDDRDTIIAQGYEPCGRCKP